MRPDEYKTWTREGHTIALYRNGSVRQGRAGVRIWDNSRQVVIGGFDLADAEPGEPTEKQIAKAMADNRDLADYTRFGQLCTAKSLVAELIQERDTERCRLWSASPQRYSETAIVIPSEPMSGHEDGPDPLVALQPTAAQLYLLEPFVEANMPAVLRVGLTLKTETFSIERQITRMSGGKWLVTYIFDDPRLPAWTEEDEISKIFGEPDLRARVSFEVQIMSDGEYAVSAAYDFRIRVTWMTGWLNDGREFGKAEEYSRGESPYCWYHQAGATSG